MDRKNLKKKKSQSEFEAYFIIAKLLGADPGTKNEEFSFL